MDVLGADVVHDEDEGEGLQQEVEQQEHVVEDAHEDEQHGGGVAHGAVREDGDGDGVAHQAEEGDGGASQAVDVVPVEEVRLVGRQVVVVDVDSQASQAVAQAVVVGHQGGGVGVGGRDPLAAGVVVVRPAHRGQFYPPRLMRSVPARQSSAGEHLVVRVLHAGVA